MMVFATLFYFILLLNFFDWKLQISKKENKFQLKSQKHLDDLLI